MPSYSQFIYTFQAAYLSFTTNMYQMFYAIWSSVYRSYHLHISLAYSLSLFRPRFRSLAQVLFLVFCLSLAAFKQRKSRCFLVIRAMLYFENVHLNFDCENRSISRKCMTENHCECLLKNTRNTEMLPMIVTVDVSK